MGLVELTEEIVNKNQLNDKISELIEENNELISQKEI